GARSFTELKMVNKINYSTFKAACFAYSLLNDDKEWTHTIAEASFWAMAPQLRDLFVTILYSELNLSDKQVRNYCLLEIQDLLNTHGKSLTNFKNLPQPNPKLLSNLDNRLLREALTFDVNKRGTGKTFLYKTIIARLRSEQMIVLVVSSSVGIGIASLLLPAGRTAHSRFVIPLELMENSTCDIKQNTHLAELMQHVRLIIWDEAPMTQRCAFEALYKTLRDIMGYKNPAKRNRIFGGMTVLLGHSYGYGCNGEIDNQKQDFNRWVLAVGDGKLPAKKKESEDEPTLIEIPEEFLIKSWTSLIEKIIALINAYPDSLQEAN
ncbi:ATP-dependent DNA helicase PIF1-like protein, partial [Tanacetum coccineum]